MSDVPEDLSQAIGQIKAARKTLLRLAGQYRGRMMREPDRDVSRVILTATDARRKPVEAEDMLIAPEIDFEEGRV